MDIAIVRQARETLAQALAASQETGSTPAADALAGQIAQTVGTLFSVEKEGSSKERGTRVVRALASLDEITTALQRSGLPGPVRKKIDTVVGETRALLRGITGTQPSAKAVHAAAAPMPEPPRARVPTPLPPGRERLSTPAPVRMSASGVTIEIDVGFTTESNFFVGFAGDLTDGGLFVSTWQPLPVGSRVIVSFTLPDGHKAKATGQVMWAREADDTAPDATPGIGVTLEGLTETDMKSVRSFMSKRAPIFHPG